jgi:hypothetical protein
MTAEDVKRAMISVRAGEMLCFELSNSLSYKFYFISCRKVNFNLPVITDLEQITVLKLTFSIF